MARPVIAFDTRAMADQKDSPFFKLPPELRNMIYALAFKDCVTSVEKPWRVKPPEEVNLLFIFKQAYTEAIEIYYSHTIIQSEDVGPLRGWASRQSQQRLQSIPEVRFTHFTACRGDQLLLNSAVRDYKFYTNELRIQHKGLAQNSLSIVIIDLAAVCKQCYI